MSDCEHQWVVGMYGRLECEYCGAYTYEVAKECLDLQDDLMTMHGLKEQYRIKVEEMQAAIAEIWRDYKGWHYELQSLEKFLPEEE